MQQTLEITIDVPKGFRAIRLDFAKKGEWYITEYNMARQWAFPFTSAYRLVILEKDATVD